MIDDYLGIGKILPYVQPIIYIVYKKLFNSSVAILVSEILDLVSPKDFGMT